jgi:hypothetical protein
MCRIEVDWKLSDFSYEKMETKRKYGNGKRNFVEQKPK